MTEGRDWRGDEASDQLNLWAMAFLALTAVVSLAVSYFHVFLGDDFLELWCDRVPSLAQLVHIERTAPLAVDPFFYHGLTFLGIRLFGVAPMLLRLPSLAGLLGMQACLFVFLRRMGLRSGAVFALALPALTGVFAYSLQLRPYGLLFGLFGVAMLSWQTAARHSTHRRGALMVLALSLAIAFNTQYYAVLLLIPLAAAELVRWWRNRRIDMGMLAAMGAGMAGMLFILPFMKAASDFKSHYQAGAVPYQVVMQSYDYLLLGQSHFTTSTQHLLDLGLAVVTVLILWSCVRQMRSGSVVVSDSELVFLIAMAALPVLGFLLGRFVTGAMEPRYVLGAVIGMAGLLAIALQPILRDVRVGMALLLLLFGVTAWKGTMQVRAEQVGRRDLLQSLVLSPSTKAAIMATPSQTLYTQDIDLFSLVTYYEPDREVLAHLALVYSPDQEMRWNHNVTSSRIVDHMKEFTPFKILPYEAVVAEPGEHLFVLTQGGWDWTNEALKAGRVEVRPQGFIFGGCELVGVRFR